MLCFCEFSTSIHRAPKFCPVSRFFPRELFYHNFKRRRGEIELRYSSSAHAHKVGEAVGPRVPDVHVERTEML